MKKLIKKYSQGFTLIELIVVISIIGILATLILINYSGARAKARDSKRKESLSTYQSAVEAYFDDYDVYPKAGRSFDAAVILQGCIWKGGGGVESWFTDICGTETVANNSRHTKYLQQTLDDPLVKSFASPPNTGDTYLWKPVDRGGGQVYLYFRYSYIGGGLPGTGTDPTISLSCSGDSNAFTYQITAGIENPNDRVTIMDGGRNDYRYEIGNADFYTCGTCGIINVEDEGSPPVGGINDCGWAEGGPVPLE